MINVEIRFKPNELIPLKYSKLHIDLNFEEALDHVDSLFTEDVDYMYISEQGSDDVLKLEKSGNVMDKSFMLNILEIGQFIH